MAEDAEIKHLEMIQGVVNRMGTNSFNVKAWAVGLIAAIFALAASHDTSAAIALAAVLPATAFWFLDAYYLRQERLFRRLYDAVRRHEPVTITAGPFSMSTKAFVGEARMGFRDSFVSATTAGMYAPLLLMVGGVSLWLSRR